MCSVRRQLVLFHLPTHSRNIWKQLHPLPELNFTGLTAQCFLFFNAFRTNSADPTEPTVTDFGDCQQGGVNISLMGVLMCLFKCAFCPLMLVE